MNGIFMYEWAQTRFEDKITSYLATNHLLAKKEGKLRDAETEADLRSIRRERFGHNPQPFYRTLG